MKRWVLVTGSATGCGRAIALELAKHHHYLIIHYRKQYEEAKKTAELCKRFGGEAEILQGDFSSIVNVEEFLAKVLAQFSRIVGLVNNVGNYLMTSLLETNAHDFMNLFQTNLMAPYLLISHLLPSLIENKGCVVNLGTSGLLTTGARPSAAVYMMTKRALWNMTVEYAKELAPHFVRVNMVSPGYLETAIDLEDPKKLPMERAATLEEVAKMISYLFSPQGEYITGQNIEIAGGVGL